MANEEEAKKPEAAEAPEAPAAPAKEETPAAAKEEAPAAAKKDEAPSAAKEEAPAAAKKEAPAAAKEEAPPTPTPVSGSKKSKKVDSDRIHGLGRRKTAVARVSLRTGEGNWVVNGRPFEEYFPRPTLQQAILRPLVLAELQGQYDVHVRVAGGGPHGQADAVRLGLARALVKIDEEYRVRMRSEDLLTRDAREVERKKPGRPKARKRFQFSKR